MGKIGRMRLGVFLAVLSLSAFACGDDDDDDDVASSLLTGTWFGSIVDDVKGEGTLDVEFSQTGSTIGGTYVTSYPNSANNDQGTISGSVNGNNVSATFNSSVAGQCDVFVDGDRAGEDRIFASFDTEPGCAQQDIDGAFDIVRD